MRPGNSHNSFQKRFARASDHCGAKSQKQRSRALALNPIKPSCGADGLRTFFFPTALVSTLGVLTCKSAAEARTAIDAARRILKQLGVELHPRKTRIVHVRYGFEFLGYKIKRGEKRLYLPESKICSQLHAGDLYAYPREKSIRRFMEQIRATHEATCALVHQGADREFESAPAGVGRVLQTRPRQIGRAHV